MPIRYVHVTVPEGREAEVAERLGQRGGIATWHHVLGGGVGRAGALVRIDDTEEVLDDLEGHLAGIEPRQVVILPVEACVPRPPEAESKPPKERGRFATRVSREELYQDISATTALDGDFIPLVVLSAIVAAVGLTAGDTATIIGAMVIAPLLGPNMALSLSVTLVDTDLAFRALRTIFVGVSIAFLFAFAVGKLYPVDPAMPEVAARTGIGVGNLLVALSAGVAGTLAFTSGAPSSLIGVMVAVALLPPLVVFGMLLAGGHLREALGALELVTGNIISVNLAAVATFWLQGVRPRRWWEAEQAKKATRNALLIWAALFVALVYLILHGPGT